MSLPQVTLMGLASPAVVGLITARITMAVRARSFRVSRARGAIPEFANLKLPAVVRTSEEQRLLDAYRGIADEQKEAAKKLQDACISYVVAASAALFTAFLGFAIGATVLAAGAREWHVYSDALDVAALSVVLVGFLRSRTLRLAWIRSRIGAELLRQWGAVEGVFVCTPNYFTAPLDAFQNDVQKKLHVQPDPSKAAATLRDSRLREMAQVLRSKAREAAITGRQLRLYLQTRPVTQAAWFERSSSRIELRKSRREAVMLILFVVAFATAALKFGLTFSTAPEVIAQWATLLFLLTSGLAAASTSAYLGHNTRSLLHRYEGQSRFIEAWFAQHQEVLRASVHDAELPVDQATPAAEAILAFEALMLNEMVDWVAISQADGMDLGLS